MVNMRKNQLTSSLVVVIAVSVSYRLLTGKRLVFIRVSGFHRSLISVSRDHFIQKFKI